MNGTFQKIFATLVTAAIIGLFYQSFIRIDEKYASEDMVNGMYSNIEKRIDNLEDTPKVIERLCTQMDSLNKDIERLRNLIDKLSTKIDLINTSHP